MNCNKSKYKDLINQSILFNLDEETQTEAYQNEKRKLLKYIYLYMVSIDAVNEDLSVEIIEEAIRCIKNFNPQKGKNFLKYFEVSWNYQFSRKKMELKIASDYCGMLSPSEVEILKRFIFNRKKYEDEHPQEHSVERMYECLAKVINVPVKKIEWIAVAQNLSRLGDSCGNDDGEEFSVWELIDSGVYVGTQQDQLDTIEEYFDFIEAVFVEQVERQKPILSDLLTIKMLEEQLNKEVLDIERYSFISKKILETWTLHHKLPTQREIAAKYHRNEASISRTLHTFLEKLKRKWFDR